MAAFTYKTDAVAGIDLHAGIDVLVPHTRAVLIAVARIYGATITYSGLAEAVLTRANLTTRMGVQNWTGELLAAVVRDQHARNEPALTALVVHANDGAVGEGYRYVLEVAGESGREQPVAREMHAASARLKCYRFFGASVPEDATPALSGRLTEVLRRRPGVLAGPARTGQTRAPRAAPAPERVRETCPECFMQYSANGLCSCV